MPDHLRLIAIRLRTAPGTALWLALLVLVTSGCAAVLPRAVDAYENEALRDTVTTTSAGERGISGSALPPAFDGTGDPAELVGPERLDRVEELFQQAIRPPLRTGADGTVYGVHNREAATTPAPFMPRPTPHLDPRATLVSQQGELTDQARLLSGRAPGGRVEVSGDRRAVEAAVTRDTAERMGLAVGESFVLPAPTGDTEIRVSGIVEPRDPEAPYWNLEPDLRAPTKVTVPSAVPGGPTTYYWHFTALLHRDAAEVTLRLPDGAELYWHHLTDPDALTAHQIPEVRRQLTALTTGAEATELERRAGVGPLEVTTSLTELLGSYERQRAAIAPIVLIAALGVGAVAVIVLLMAVTLTGERRREELDLMRSRGASLTGLAGLVLAETAVIVLPAATVGTLFALEFGPSGPGSRTGPALALAAAVAALATLAPVLRAVVVHRRPLGSAGRRDLVRGRPSRRRTVAELTLLVVVAGAVWTLRRTGSGPDADSGSDTFLAATPLLLSLAAALLLLRLYPLPLRLLARFTARRRGPVAFLGLAQAGRSPAATGLPLTALLVAVTVASFGGTVLTGVSDARERAALTDVGADARIAVASDRSEAATGDAPLALPATLTQRVADLPGVGEALPVRVESGATLADTSNSLTSVDLVVVEPEEYARLADRTGLGRFSAEALRDRPDQPEVPALVSPGLAAGLEETGTVATMELELPVRPVAVLDRTPAVPGGGEFAVLPADAVQRLLDGLGLTDSATRDTNVLLVTASDRSGSAIDAAALRAVTEADAPFATVTLRAERRAQYGDSTLQSGASTLYRGAVGGAAGFSVLALLLSLLQTAAGHRRLLSALRALGLGRGPARRLIMVELLPQYLVAVVGGALVAWGSVALLRPGVDLAALAGTGSAGDGDPVELGVSVQALGVPALAVLAVGGAALLLHSWRLSRRGQSNDLRTVDT